MQFIASQNEMQNIQKAIRVSNKTYKDVSLFSLK